MGQPLSPQVSSWSLPRTVSPPDRLIIWIYIMDIWISCIFIQQVSSSCYAHSTYIMCYEQRKSFHYHSSCCCTANTSISATRKYLDPASQKYVSILTRKKGVRVSQPRGGLLHSVATITYNEIMSQSRNVDRRTDITSPPLTFSCIISFISPPAKEVTNISSPKKLLSSSASACSIESNMLRSSFSTAFRASQLSSTLSPPLTATSSSLVCLASFHRFCSFGTVMPIHETQMMIK
jgi:hypothetical protein